MPRLRDRDPASASYDAINRFERHLVRNGTPRFAAEPWRVYCFGRA